MLKPEVCNTLNNYITDFSQKHQKQVYLIDSECSENELHSSILTVGSLPFVYREWVMTKLKAKSDSPLDLNMLYFILDMPLPLREALSITLERSIHGNGDMLDYFIESESSKAPDLLLYIVTKEQAKEYTIDHFTFKNVEGFCFEDHPSKLFYCVKRIRDKTAVLRSSFSNAMLAMSDWLRTDLRQFR